MGKLDGLTLLRYGHVYDSGGGMEQYLADLNRALTARNRFTTIQVQLTSDPARVGEFEEPVSQGKHLRVSLYVDQSSHERAIHGAVSTHGVIQRLKSFLLKRVLTAPVIFPLLTRPLVSRKPKRRPGEPDCPSQLIDELHARHKVDLIVLHHVGGADTTHILRRARHHKIPVTYIHHFSNDRLANISLRAEIDPLPWVGGVCDIDTPRRLRKRFVNVSDGIDTEFYRRENARSLAEPPKAPLIFLPARITPAKGQCDLIRAAGNLKRSGVNFCIALAGRVESDAFLKELEALIAAEGLTDRVRFIGQLGPEQLRDWYAAATVMAFPTHHNEGLGRITVEAQSMMTPAVVYSIGGTPESLLDGITGYLVPLGDLETLTRRLAEILQSPEKRKSMANAGRDFVLKRFSLEALAQRHENFYLQALGKTP
jgi:glycosyltransferase involved in cell wall biosynthesis